MKVFLDTFLGFFFPRRCVGCGRLRTYYCTQCVSQIEIVPPFCIVCNRVSFDGSTHSSCSSSLDGIYALGHYRGSLKRAIKLLKYHSVSDLSFTLSSLLVQYYPRYIPQFDYIVPVPLHRKRLRMRGYNQSALIARSLSTLLSLPYSSDILHRTHFTHPQVELRIDERRTNVLHNFSYTSAVPVLGKTIALVDDVATTGATLLECSNVLKRHGAECVWGIVLAHGN